MPRFCFLQMLLLFFCCATTLLSIQETRPADPEPVAGKSADLEFAEQFLEAILAGDLNELSRFVDHDTFYKRAFEGIELAKDSKLDLPNATRNGLTGRRGAMANIVNTLKSGGTFKFVRSRKIADEQRLLFRHSLPDGGINYYDYILRAQNDGSLKIVDFDTMIGGDLFSSIWRQAFLPAISSENASFFQKLTGKKSAFVKDLSKISEMNEAIRNGDAKRGLEIFATLSKETQESKLIQLNRRNAAQMSGDDVEYEKAMKEIRHLFPKDRAIDFISIDYFFLKKDMDSTLKCIDAVSKSVDGDAYMDYLRASVLLSVNRFAEAKTSAQVAIEKEVDLIAAYWTLVAIALGEKNNAEVLKWLKTIDTTFELSWADLTQQPEYAEFVKSPEYKLWLEYLDAK